ncbi:MAG: GNAT family N-acetyltransferase [Rhodoglobus sp.]|uniref:GNAT family N-acetyltransferase n=1 Tax=Salinibacterium sp. G-O1 TaxID=3046208 RepID=UPI0024B8F19D|nr:GNAT family N-acetyltransferase [Salinibacterium sp. G-O1]MDJ0334240.1 GNAT family N-acetyltransferase [Salinibacterium sp. G-O1]
MGELRLEELSAKTIVAANNLTLRRGQEQFVTPPTYAIADAYLSPVTSWPRVVLNEDDEVVGFIRGNFDPESTQEEFRSCIWRVTVSGDEQGKGVGRFAVVALAEEAKSRGFDRVTALWEPGDDGPEAFFLAVGFTITGQSQYGENIGVLGL